MLRPKPGASFFRRQLRLALDQAHHQPRVVGLLQHLNVGPRHGAVTRWARLLVVGVIDALSARPSEPIPADADAVAQRFAVADHQWENVCGVSMMLVPAGSVVT